MSSNSSMSPIKTLQTGYIVRLLYVALGMLFAVHLFGTIGYMVLTEGKYSWFDCFYMTFITFSVPAICHCYFRSLPWRCSKPTSMEP